MSVDWPVCPIKKDDAAVAISNKEVDRILLIISEDGPERHRDLPFVSGNCDLDGNSGTAKSVVLLLANTPANGRKEPEPPQEAPAQRSGLSSCKRTWAA